ncbi:MAG: type IV pilus assembly protein PilM [bacterium]
MLGKILKIIGSKKNKGIGIDIGTDSVKIIEIEKTTRGIELVNFGLSRLPEGTIVDGVITNSMAVEEAIKNIIQKNNFHIKKGTVVTSISGKFAIVKKIKMPLLQEKEIRQSIMWEAEQYIPFDIKDVIVDFQILATSENEKGTDVLLVAIKKERIHTHLEILNKLKLSPSIIDVDSFAVVNSYLTNTTNKEGVVAFINLGANTTNIIILNNEELQFTRDIAMGSKEITQAISQEMKISYEEAENYKKTQTVNLLSVNNILENLIMEIQRSIDYYKSSFYNMNVGKIILSGGGAKYKNIDRILNRKLNLFVEIINPFKKIQFNPIKFPPEYLQEISSLSSTCLGLALRKVIE